MRQALMRQPWFNSLEQVANHLGVNSKTSVEPRQWLAAALDGSRRAMRYIVDYCVQDVLDTSADQLGPVVS